MRSKNVARTIVVAVALVGSLVSVATAIEGRSAKATAVAPQTAKAVCPFAGNHVAGRTCCSNHREDLTAILSAN